MELVLKFFTTLIKRRCVYWLMWQNCLHWKNQQGTGPGSSVKLPAVTTIPEADRCAAMTP